MNEFRNALDIYLERMKFELGYITREIEKNELEHAFLLKKRYSYEQSIQEARKCQKNSKQ